MTLMRSLFLLPLLLCVAADTSPRSTQTFFAEHARLVNTIQLPHGFNGLSQAVLSGNGKMCAMESGRDVIFYSTITGKEVSTITSPPGQHDGAFSYDGSRYATADTDGKVRLWDTESGTELQQFDVGGAFS